jgi:hypothetical protein
VGAYSFSDLSRHIGHNIMCVPYGEPGGLVNIAVECENCNEVLLDFDRKEKEFIVGDVVVVDDPRFPGDNWDHSFIGTIIEKHRNCFVVEDMLGDIWEVDPESLTLN